MCILRLELDQWTGALGTVRLSAFVFALSGYFALTVALLPRWLERQRLGNGFLVHWELAEKPVDDKPTYQDLASTIRGVVN